MSACVAASGCVSSLPLAFAFHELVTDGLKRMNDMAWAKGSAERR